MRRPHPVIGFSLAGFVAVAVLLAPTAGRAHPMGNFSISHYSALRVLADGVELRYLLDLAEIPTFQEIQASGIVPEAGHPSLAPYLARKAETLASGLVLELNGRRLALETTAREILFTPGAGDLPTMKLGAIYRAGLDAATISGVNRLSYRDENFPERAGWKEVIGIAEPDVVMVEASVPQRDRSRQLADYPTDLLSSPPQILEASLAFSIASAPVLTAGVETPPRPGPAIPPSSPVAARAVSMARDRAAHAVEVAPPAPEARSLALEPNRQAGRRDRFTDLIAMPHVTARVFLFAALVAAILGAFHALEPGHGKTVVAAYLVGSRGTARHALFLGLIVTASHTAGVYLLGGLTLYASRYIVPERLYPWLGAVSGLIIAGLGVMLFLKRYAGAAPHHHGHPHTHVHAHVPGVEHAHEHGPAHEHSHGHHHDSAHPHAHTGDGHTHAHHHHHYHPPAGGAVSLRELLALGIIGGIVPCPAALVVLLSAVALRRVGFGLLLIVAFSVGLAAVLIGIGLLVVYARRAMARFQGEGPFITRWLPLTSSAVMTLLGIGIAVQAFVAAGRV